jgi:hypothetical protein
MTEIVITFETPIIRALLQHQLNDTLFSGSWEMHIYRADRRSTSKPVPRVYLAFYIPAAEMALGSKRTPHI